MPRQQFEVKAKVLNDLIEHHAKKEETEMFPKLKKKLSRDELSALGDDVEAMKKRRPR